MILPSVLSLSSGFGYLWAFFVKSEFVKTWVMLCLSSRFYFVLFWYLLAFRLAGNSLAAWLKYTLKAWNQEPNWNFYIISLFLERFLWFQEDWMISWVFNSETWLLYSFRFSIWISFTLQVLITNMQVQNVQRSRPVSFSFPFHLGAQHLPGWWETRALQMMLMKFLYSSIPTEHNLNLRVPIIRARHHLEIETLLHEKIGKIYTVCQAIISK